MQAQGFFSSLFDFSFSSFITPRIVRILYIVTTILVALWTLAFVLIAFNASSAAGIFMLLIGGPIFFVISMIYVRVGLELLIAFFHIHEDVSGINGRAGGAVREAAPDAPPTTEAGPAAAPA